MHLLHVFCIWRKETRSRKTITTLEQVWRKIAYRVSELSPPMIRKIYNKEGRFPMGSHWILSNQNLTYFEIDIKSITSHQYRRMKLFRRSFGELSLATCKLKKLWQLFEGGGTFIFNFIFISLSFLSPTSLQQFLLVPLSCVNTIYSAAVAAVEVVLCYSLR